MLPKFIQRLLALFVSICVFVPSYVVAQDRVKAGEYQHEASSDIAEVDFENVASSFILNDEAFTIQSLEDALLQFCHAEAVNSEDCLAAHGAFFSREPQARSSAGDVVAPSNDISYDDLLCKINCYLEWFRKAWKRTKDFNDTQDAACRAAGGTVVPGGTGDGRNGCKGNDAVFRSYAIRMALAFEGDRQYKRDMDKYKKELKDCLDACNDEQQH